MRMANEAGEVVYYNPVMKHGNLCFVVQAASGQTLPGRDRQKRKTRSFSQQHQAEAFLRRMGYTVDY